MVSVSEKEQLSVIKLDGVIRCACILMEDGTQHTLNCATPGNKDCVRCLVPQGVPKMVEKGLPWWLV